VTANRLWLSRAAGRAGTSRAMIRTVRAGNQVGPANNRSETEDRQVLAQVCGYDLQAGLWRHSHTPLPGSKLPHVGRVMLFL